MNDNQAIGLTPQQPSLRHLWWAVPAVAAAMTSPCHFMLHPEWVAREYCFGLLLAAMTLAGLVGIGRAAAFHSGLKKDEKLDRALTKEDVEEEERKAASRNLDLVLILFFLTGLPFLLVGTGLLFHQSLASAGAVSAHEAYFDSTWIVVAVGGLLILVPLWMKVPDLRLRGRRKRFVVNISVLFALVVVALSAARPHLLPPGIHTWLSIEVWVAGSTCMNALVAIIAHPLVRLVCAGMGDRASVHTRTRGEVNAVERRGCTKDRLGIALSGGGVRAGTIALGVLDRFREDKLLERSAYLSSVSGGGWAVGTVLAQLVRGAVSPVESAILRFREARDYLGLADGARALVTPLLYTAIATATFLLAIGLAVMSALSMVLYVDQTRLEVLTPTSKAILALPAPYFSTVSQWLMDVGRWMEWVFTTVGMSPVVIIAARNGGPDITEQLASARGALGLTLCAGLAVIVFSGVLILLSQVRGQGRREYLKELPRRIRSWGFGGLALTLGSLFSLGLLFSATLAASVGIVVLALAIVSKTLDWSAARSTAIGGILIGFIQLLGKQLDALRGAFSWLDAWWGNGVERLARFLIENAKHIGDAASWNYPTQTTLLVAACGFGVAFYFVSFLIGLEQIGLGVFWRDRLNDAFWRDERSEQKAKAQLRTMTKEQAAQFIDPKALTWTSVRKQTGTGTKWPIPIINGTLNSPTTRDGGLHFEFTPQHTGNLETGWVEEFDGSDRICSITDALAISSAALNSQGGSSIPRALRGVLSFIPVKMGRWLRAPRTPRHSWQPLALEYVLLEALGFNSVDDPYLFVSDGGHLENLGLLALLHRDVEIMVAVDAAADPDYTFNDLTRFIDLARREGWDLELDIERLCPPDKPNQYGLKVPAARVVVGTLTRGEGAHVEKRWLVYGKSALGQGLNAATWAYARREKTFPQETTADQLFDEEQFEAYLKLGECLGDDLSAGLRTAEAARAQWRLQKPAMP